MVNRAIPPVAHRRPDPTSARTRLASGAPAPARPRAIRPESRDTPQLQWSRASAAWRAPAENVSACPSGFRASGVPKSAPELQKLAGVGGNAIRGNDLRRAERFVSLGGDLYTRVSVLRKIYVSTVKPAVEGHKISAGQGLRDVYVSQHSCCPNALPCRRRLLSFQQRSWRRRKR